MSYTDKLKDPRWQKMRLRVLEESGWRCERCGDESRPLHVHHREYRNVEPWEYTRDELAVLCDRCHKMEHKPSVVIDFIKAQLERTKGSSLWFEFRQWADLGMLCMGRWGE